MISLTTGLDPMSENTTIACPKCQKRLIIPTESLGAKVQCPGCKTVLQTPAPKGNPTSGSKPKPPAPSGVKTNPASGSKAPAPPAGKPPAPTPAPAQTQNSKVTEETDDEAGGYGVNREEDIPRCPSCANEVESHNTVICLTCGYNIRTRTVTRIRRLVHKGFADYLLWHGLAILYTFLVIGIIVWDILVFTKMPDWLGGPESWGGSFVGGGFFRLWNTIISLFGIWYMGRFAFVRFFLEPHPPEEEIIG